MMLVQDIINLINLEADELLDQDTDNIPYINSAIDFLSFTLCGMKDPEMISCCDIAPGLAVPSNFVAFVPANGYPVFITGGLFNTTSGAVVRQVSYSTAKPHVSLITDQVPFKDMYCSVLVLIVSYMIKKKTYIPTEYVNSDKAFVTDVLAAIKAAKETV